MENIQERTVNIPSTTRLFAISHVFLYCLSWLTNWTVILEGIPYYICRYLEFWRVFTAPFAGNNFVSIVPTFLMFCYFSSKIERSHGSVKHLVLLIAIGCLSSTLVLLLCWVISFRFPSYYTRTMFSMWSINMTLCLTWYWKHPDAPVQICFDGLTLKSKYLPRFFMVLGALMFLKLESVAGAMAWLMSKK